MFFTGLTACEASDSKDINPFNYDMAISRLNIQKLGRRQNALQRPYLQ
jgi:hypothetical protein